MLGFQAACDGQAFVVSSDFFPGILAIFLVGFGIGFNPIKRRIFSHKGTKARRREESKVLTGLLGSHPLSFVASCGSFIRGPIIAHAIKIRIRMGDLPCPTLCWLPIE